ncbi:MAG TPA: glucuronate isomerase [Polyangiaceae bacterium]|jgi:glucuronate isomerase
MAVFIDENFLLESTVARDLYHGIAKALPIIDYHCHLPPEAIAENHQFRTLTEIWLNDDHYKWRAMRANGVSERYITGDASDWEKFEAWARTVPYTLRNPLYHWTHLELGRPFGIRDRLLDTESAPEIYELCNRLLATPEFSAQGLLEQFNVLVVCSTDDPTDSLEAHQRHARNSRAKTRLYPTWRPDRALALEDLAAYNDWLDGLEARSGVAIASFGSFLEAMRARHAFFHELGCRASDHGLETPYAESYRPSEVERAFDKARSRKELLGQEIAALRSAILHELALLDHERGWVQQFHLGALRNTNTRMFERLGPNTGFDSIGDWEVARPLARFLDRLDRSEQLPRTILYNLNPRDNELFATMVGNFQDGAIPGKIQYGSSWWFLDQLDGMEKQLNALSNMGLLSRFVGMLTDSRSFLSYSRHDYFRRLLCNLLGNDIKRGLIPDQREMLQQMVADICFHNANRYFRFGLPAGAAPSAGAA